MSAWTCRNVDGKAARKIVLPRSRIPYWKGLCAESEEKHEPASDIEHCLVDGLKALDPNRPIREADMCGAVAHVCFGPIADISEYGFIAHSAATCARSRRILQYWLTSAPRPQLARE